MIQHRKEDEGDVIPSSLPAAGLGLRSQPLSLLFNLMITHGKQTFCLGRIWKKLDRMGDGATFEL